MLISEKINYSTRCRALLSSSTLILTTILLMPVLSNYVLAGPISIGDFFFILVLFNFIRNLNFSTTNIFTLFLALIFLSVSFLKFSIFYNEELFWQLLRICFYFFSFFIIFSLRVFNPEKFYRLYQFFGMLFSSAIIFQWVLYHFFGLNIPFQLPLPVYELDTLTQIDHVYRSGGLFKEPSYFAIFVTPLIFYLSYKKNYFPLSVLVIAGIMSTSTLFIFIMLLSFVFLPLRIFLFLIFILLFAVAAAAFAIPEIFDELIFLVRFIAIFVDGGTLNDRLFPVISLAEESSLFYSYIAFNNLYSSGYWFSSLGSLMAGLGFLSVIFISVNFFRIGLIFGGVLFFYLLTTHFMSGVYSVFLFFSFLALRIYMKGDKV